MPLAARVGDKHRCSKADPIPHVGGEILASTCRTVFIGRDNVARVGDMAFCAGDAHDVILTGERTVLIQGKAAARLGDATDGGHIISGCSTVLIGPHPRVKSLIDAAREGTPFCEKAPRVVLEDSED
jgi:uncharacterized Zn-binding protein involved in type VI secretion